MDEAKLNPQQQAAVNHDEGPLLVVAGAGTGKTQVITQRIARLIKQAKAKPEEILALTFTEKAAGEMLERLDGLVGWEAYRIDVMTFHAFGLQLLQRFGHHMGWSTRTEVISDTAKLILLKQNLSQVKLSYYGPQNDVVDFLAEMIDYIEALQNADVDVDQFRHYVEGLKPAPGLHQLDIDELQDKLKLYQLYEQLKQKFGLIDYHDQVKLPLQLLQQKPNIIERLRAQYKYVLVDEYQDTNGAQDALLRALVAKDGNIFAVGDDDQAIYGFRGAKLTNILKFTEHFAVKQSEALIENYRSTQPILDRAYAMIQHNDPQRLEARLGLDKRLHAQISGEAPRFVGYETNRQEYEGVAGEIADLLQGGTAPEDIAVLAPSHQPLRLLARVLRQRGIPYRLSSNVNIFEQPELIQLWYLLGWIAMNASDEAIAQVLLGPFVGWNPSQVRGIIETSGQNLTSIETVLAELADKDGVVKEFVQRLALWREWAREMPVSQLVYQMIFETGLSEQWVKAAERSPRMVRVFEDLQVWLRQMQQFESVALNPTLSGYLETFIRPPEVDSEEISGEENGVSLLTIHASKGLEFDSVYIVNNTQDSWGQKAAGRLVELPEELLEPDLDLPPEHERRRLLYVAMTRAKRQLVFTAPTKQKNGRDRKLSPFLSEVFDISEIRVEQTGDTDSNLEKALSNLQRFAPPLVQEMPQLLPFESSDGWITLSTSDIEAYNACPYEFYLEKILKIRLPIGPQANFGTILHDLFRDYYQSRQRGEGYSLEELLRRLDDRWTARGYQSVEEAELAHQQAAQTIAYFYQREEKAGRRLRASEESFSLVIDEAKLRVKGRIDASFETSDGIEIRDFKTGRAHDTEKLAERAKNKSLQLRTYAVAMQEMTGQVPARVVLDYIVTATEGIAILSPQILKNHRQKLVEIAQAIRARQFMPKKDLYHTCIAYRYWGEPEEEEADA